MIRSSLLILAPALALGACAGKTRIERPPPAPVPETFQPARLVPPIAPSQAAHPVSRAVERLALPAAPPEPPASPPLAQVEAANRSAVREPGGAAYINAAQVYDWAAGALYRLYTAPERVSEIALQSGEALVSVAAGDTARWVIGDTTSGSGAARRTHVLVKPTAAGLRTNLVIATDRRVYHVLLESTADVAMASVAWNYPEDALMAIERSEGALPGPAVASGVDLEALNFGYLIEGDAPPWRPLRAFDDGSQVFIEFPRSLAQSEAPPLFVSGESGRTELVNYRQRGRFYIADRLFSAAELRLGERRQQVVRIVRTGAGHAPGTARSGG